MTNYEKIKNMSVEEMADFITNATNGCEYGCGYCKNYIDGECAKDGYMHDYVKGCIEWLNSEVEECPKCVYEYDGEVQEYCVQGPCPHFKTVEQIRAEAIKAFVERLKHEIINKPSKFSAEKGTYDFLTGSAHRQFEILDLIDGLAKGMAGENE